MEKVNSHWKCNECKVVSWHGEWLPGEEHEQFVCPECGCISTPITVEPTWTETDAKRLRELKDRKAEIEKEEKPLAEKMKKFLLSSGISKMPYSENVLSITYQDRSTMDEDKLVSFLQNKLSEETINNYKPFKTATNPEAIKQLLIDGIITLEELGACKIPNIVTVFNFKPKKEEKVENNPFGGML